MKTFSIGVIISTYNNPAWLEKTLWSYEAQERRADEIIIADDGSTDTTRSLIEEFEKKLPIIHAWHQDEGFRKTKILNEALRLTTADYLIFTDQDCVARQDFIATHEKYAEKGYFLSGGYFKLPLAVSNFLSKEDIFSGDAFNLKWLLKRGVKMNIKSSKLIRNEKFTKMMNIITPARATWNGMNSSGWREDIISVNGFDERMKYGGEDREMGERLFNKGIRSKQIRYSAITLHLYHDRPYVSKESWQLNNIIRKQTRKEHIVMTPYGINEL
ncbi:MAG: glycosyltransferase family 2 protein [Bacteroidaceae bacterium]|nr:glycosyltransferase family 2 protein [Bacteroidaceae bacterium]